METIIDHILYTLIVVYCLGIYLPFVFGYLYDSPRYRISLKYLGLFFVSSVIAGAGYEGLLRVISMIVGQRDTVPPGWFLASVGCGYCVVPILGGVVGLRIYHLVKRPSQGKRWGKGHPTGARCS